MKQRKHILTFILVLIFGSTFAHYDCATTKNFGNVIVRTCWSDVERMYKLHLLGRLAEEFAKQLNYSDTIFLDFGYLNPMDKNTYFISYDKGTVYYYGIRTYTKDFLKEDAIVIRQFAKQLDAQTTLKLLEYAILNIQKIKSSQKIAKYTYKGQNWTITSIDTKRTKQILNKPNTTLINNALKLKFERETENFDYGISYYLQNNKYTIFLRTTNKDTNLITLDNIYRWEKIGTHSIIFDTDSSFHFIYQSYNNAINDFEIRVSKRQIIQNLFYRNRFKDIQHIGENKYAICILELHNDGTTKERTSIYLIDEDELIQDLDELIKNKKE